MVHHDKPMTLSGLQKLMQVIDACYWECKAEIACEAPATNSSGNKSEKKDNNKSSSNKGKCKVHNSIAVYAAVVAFIIILCTTEAL